MRNLNCTGTLRILSLSITLLILPSRAAVAQNKDDPKLKDPQQAAKLLLQYYPEDLRLLGIGGRVKLNVRVQPRGTVDSATVLSGSGTPSLDEAATSTALELDFVSPAETKWLEIDLVFTPAFPAPLEFS